MKLNKKAMGEEILWIIRIMLIVALIVFIVVIVNSSTGVNTDTYNLESYIFINRMVYSGSGIAYSDKATGRVYPGTIDINLFTQDEIDKITEDFNSNVMMKLELEYLDKTKEKITPIYYKKREFEAFYNQAVVASSNDEEDLAPVSLLKSPYKIISEKRYILIKSGANTYPGILKISTVVKQE